jgi:hypothetical protein
MTAIIQLVSTTCFKAVLRREVLRKRIWGYRPVFQPESIFSLSVIPLVSREVYVFVICRSSLSAESILSLPVTLFVNWEVYSRYLLFYWSAGRDIIVFWCNSIWFPTLWWRLVCSCMPLTSRPAERSPTACWAKRVIINMLLPVTCIVLHIYEPYWYYMVHDRGILVILTSVAEWRSCPSLGWPAGTVQLWTYCLYSS